MLRQRLKDALKAAMLEKNARTVAAVRLIMAALKDRDIAVRPEGRSDGISDDEILQMLQSMIKQRRESIVLYEKGNRADLVAQESEEIVIIEHFLPEQMSEAETAEAVGSVISEIGAQSIKDMGRTMAALKERYAGKMDFAKVSAIVKQKLSP